MKPLLVLTGWLLCIPAILLGPLVKFFMIDTDRPWVDGVVTNTIRAYAKYDTKSWIRRMISIYKNPDLTLQYLRILFNKQEVEIVGDMVFETHILENMHSVQTDHEHHRKRVAEARTSTKPHSKYGGIIVVDKTVHDGNHRLAAAKEAGQGFIQVELWRSK